MISIRTALRVMPAAWFALPLAMLAGWYATLLASPPGYGVGATAVASGTLPFTAAFVGGTAAWEARRLRVARMWGGPWVRPGLDIASRALVVPVIAGVVSILVATAVALADANAFPPDLALLAVMFVNIVAWASVGFALGLRAPKALGIPVAAILPVLWLAFVPAMYPVWLRHLTGMYRDCCTLYQQLSGQAVIASILMDLAFIVVAMIFTSRWEVGRRAVGSVAVLLVGGILATQAASGLGFAPVSPRDPALLSCTRIRTVDVCLWPEHLARGDDIRSTVADVHERWRAADIEAPPRYSEAWDETSPNAVFFHPIDPLSEDGVVMALADGMLPQVDCGFVATQGGAALRYLEAWYAVAGGLSEAAAHTLDLPGWDSNPSILEAVDALIRASPAQRQAWVSRAVAASQSCADVSPDLRVTP